MSSDTRKTLKEFMDTEGYSEKSSISLSNISDADGSGTINRGDDLGGTRTGAASDPLTPLLDLFGEDAQNTGLLGDYLSYISKNFHRTDPNEYFILRSNIPAEATDRGNPIPEPSNRQGANNTFTEGAGLSDTLSSYSNSQLFDNAPGAKDILETINKTGDPGAVNAIGEAIPTGHHLFNEVNAATDETRDESAIVNSAYFMLRNNNRFVNSKIYADDDDLFIYSYENNISGSKSFALSQATPGEFKKDGEDGHKHFKFDALERVGLDILKSASMFSNASVETSADAIAAKSSSAAPFRKPGADGIYIDARADTGAFELGNTRKIKKSFTSPDNKFTDDEINIDEKIRDEKSHFKIIVDKFLTKLDSVDGESRKNNSVYTVHGYKESVDKALDIYFSLDSSENKHDAFFANIANVLAQLIDEEGVELTPGNERVGTGMTVAKKFIDTMAVLGDVHLTLETNGSPSAGGGGSKLHNPKGHWNVDDLKDGPGTRVSKSRSKGGESGLSLAWRGSSVPSIYHLPASVIRASQNMGNLGDQNPMKGMIAGGIVDKTYFGLDINSEVEKLKSKGAKSLLETPAGLNRIPKLLVQKIERDLDAEYVPFYFHDLRTNEIISFHAFLTDLSDGFKASYDDNVGFGRMDPVRIYKNTTRDIGFTFMVAATSEQDFDEMWFKINKLVTLLYPQWSQGEKISPNKKTTFIRPFSQVPVGSPMIRLRIGDVIKSNYSRFNLSRIFGSGYEGSVIDPKDVRATSLFGMIAEALADNDWFSWVADVHDTMQAAQTAAANVMLRAMLMAIGSPLQYLELIPDETPLGMIGKRLLADIAMSDFDGNGGFVNGHMSPLLVNIYDRFRHPDSPGPDPFGSGGKGAKFGDAVMLKPSMGKYYLSPVHGVNVKNSVPFFGKVSGLDKINPTGVGGIDKDYINNFHKIKTTHHIKCRVIGEWKNEVENVTYYNVAAVNGGPLEGHVFTVTFDDFVMDPDYVFDCWIAPLLDPIMGVTDKLQDLVDTFAGTAGVSAGNINIFSTTFEDFMHPVNNSITRAFETTNGRGLAGFITSLDFSWIDGETTPWETSFGSRAPKLCKIQVKFDPVHDIAPGLDSDGFNRAPTHNVGSIMNNIAGDPYEKGFENSKLNYDKQWKKGNVKKV